MFSYKPPRNDLGQRTGNGSLTPLNMIPIWARRGGVISRALLVPSGIDLENIVYYKDDTHYFVMTAKKQCLLRLGVLRQVRLGCWMGKEEFLVVGPGS